LRSDPPSPSAKAGWSPLTKLLLVVAAVAVPYLLWTEEDTPSTVAPPPSLSPNEPESVTDADEPQALELYALPPLERFAAVVERPLFSPTRRMPPIPEPPPEAPPVEAAPEPEPEPVGPEEPELRFFGTARQGGRSAALVTFPATNAVARLGVGDRVGEWEVIEVDRNRLLLGTGEERRSYEIFGAGAPGVSAAPLPDAAAGPLPEPTDADPEGFTEPPMSETLPE
jgi:hypothetical protein